MRAAVLAPDHPDLAKAALWLGRCHQSLGELAEAEAMIRRALAVHAAREQDGPVFAAQHIRLNLSGLLIEQDRLAEAQALFAPIAAAKATRETPAGIIAKAGKLLDAIDAKRATPQAALSR